MDARERFKMPEPLVDWSLGVSSAMESALPNKHLFQQRRSEQKGLLS